MGTIFEVDEATGNAKITGILSITPTINQLVLGTTNTTTISSVAPVASRTITLPDAGANSYFVLTEGNQTINGTKSFGTTITGSISGNSGTVTDGVYTTGSYADPSWITSLAGSKLTGAYTSAGLTLATSRLLGRTTVLAGAAEEISVGSSLTLSSDTLDTIQAITISSTPTFASETLSATTNQLILGTTKTTTIDSVAPASSQTLTIPDSGSATAHFVLDQGNYTIGGIWSFSNNVTLTNQQAVVFNDTEGSPKSVTIEAPNTITSSYTLKWPVAQSTGSQVLANDGSGNLSWNTAVTSSNFMFNEIPSGTVNGNNVTFTLAHTPTTGTVAFYKNGILQNPNSSYDYSITGNMITCTFAPLSGSKLLVNYLY